MTSGLRPHEIAAPNTLYRIQKQRRVVAKPFWPRAFVERIRAVVHAVAPMGYEDENGFYFGEQPACRKMPVGDRADSSI